MTSPNRAALVRVAQLLGPLTDRLVFVGGRVAELLVTELGSTRIRPTDDSDAVFEAATVTEYYRLADQLRVRGFVEDITPGAPLCRWRLGVDILDVMPTSGDILGFRNRWYDHAIRLSVAFEPDGVTRIRIAPAPVFLATKWEAFGDRGGGDWYGSHDMEDIVAVVAGRPELIAEIESTERDVRSYLAASTRVFLDSGLAEDVIRGALPDSRLVPALVTRTLERFERIAACN